MTKVNLVYSRDAAGFHGSLAERPEVKADGVNLIELSVAIRAACLDGKELDIRLSAQATL